MRDPNRFDMTDSEALLIGVDFSSQMCASDTIDVSNANGTTAVVVLDEDGAEVSGMIETDSLTISSQTLQARILNAVAGTRYSMRFLAATSNGDYLETILTVRAKD